MRILFRCSLALFCVLAAAPAGAQQTAGSGCGGSRGPVPHPLPRALLLSSEDIAALSSWTNQLWTSDRMSGPYPRNVVAVSFVGGTPTAQIQAAVDRVCGEVIGPGFTGVLVRVPTDGTHDALWAAVDALAALAQVQRAAPDIFILVPESPFISAPPPASASDPGSTQAGPG